MYAKLAARNVRRQIKNYLIYFVTLVLNISLMFAINSVTYSDQIQKFSEASDDIEAMYRIITIMVSVTSALILSYATSFMMKLRRKEFGMYMTMGMSRGNIQILFACENAILFVIALVVGMGVGLFVYQILMAAVSSIMDMKFVISSYSVKGMLFTIIISALMFLIASAGSLLYLRKVSISELLKVSSKERTEKHPRAWMVFLMICTIGMLFSFWKVYQGIIHFNELEGPEFILWLILCLIAVFAFHATASRALAGWLLRNDRRKNKATNVVVYRGLAAKMSINAFLIGAMAVLFLFAIVASHLGISEKRYSDEEIKDFCPFDIMLSQNAEESFEISKEEGESIIENYSSIAERYSYKLYSLNEATVCGCIIGADEMGWVDIFMPLSTYNALAEKCGKKQLKLENDFQIVSSIKGLMDEDYSKCKLKLQGKEYQYGGVCMQGDSFVDAMLYIVIPDEALEKMPVTTLCTVYQLENSRYDAISLLNQLCTVDKETGDELCNYRIKEYYRTVRDAQAGSLIISMLYVATIFVCMALAILSLKTLSTVDEERERYRILFRIGVDSDLQKKTLFKQTMMFFALPFVIPFLLNIPVTIGFAEIYQKWGFDGVTGQGALFTGGITGVTLLLIYLLYFMITYRVTKDQVICLDGDNRK